MKNYDTLVISGGDIKGISALGSLYYLYTENGLQNIRYYVGTSVGSMICFLLTIGYTPLELIDHVVHSPLIDEMKTLNVGNILQRKGVINYYIIQENLESLTIKKIGYLPTLENIYKVFNKTLVITAYNFTKGQVEYLSHVTSPNLPALTAVRMSCNIPVLFDRFFYMGCEYIDGAFGDNFPIDHFDNKTHTTIGIKLKGHSSKCTTDDKNLAKYIIHLMMVPFEIMDDVKIQKSGADVIVITSTAFQLFDYDLSTSQKLDNVSIGYQAAKLLFEKNDTVKKETKPPTILDNVSLITQIVIREIEKRLTVVPNNLPSHTEHQQDHKVQTTAVALPVDETEQKLDTVVYENKEVDQPLIAGMSDCSVVVTECDKSSCSQAVTVVDQPENVVEQLHTSSQ